LALHGLPTTLRDDVAVDDVLAAIQMDKKRTAAGLGFVLLERPGAPVTGQAIEPDRVRAAVEELSPR
jgi:3-dehydroquinate synthetase